MSSAHNACLPADLEGTMFGSISLWYDQCIKEEKNMKTMTCKQLYGPCDALIHGETADEMMENSQKHAMDMVAHGDKVHIDAMEIMRKQHMDMWT